MSFTQKEIYIVSCSSWLPSSFTPVENAIDNGEYTISDAKEMGYVSISIAEDCLDVIDIAELAAKTSLKNAQVAGHQLEMLTYNAIHRHGYPQLWCPASYLQRTLRAGEALPLSIYQGCNGQLLSISMLSQVLQTSEKKYALSIAADKFSNGGINRWHGDYGIVYGDAATAVVLSCVGGIAKIINLQTVSDPSLESLHRFDQTYHDKDPEYNEKQYNVRRAKKQFLEKFGKETLTQATYSALHRLWQKIFSDGANNPEEIRYFIFPNLGKNILKENYYPVYTSAESKSLWSFGKQVGHLGASDCVAGVTYLLETNKVVSGDKVLCISAGSGFSWSFMLIEMV